MQIPLVVKKRITVSLPGLNPDYFLILLLKAHKRQTTIWENIFIGWGLLLSPKFRSILSNVEETYPNENWLGHKLKLFLLSFIQVVLLAIIAFTLYSSFSNKALAWNTITINKGHKGFVMLPDSSEVHLNASTILKVSASYNTNGELLLDGEAHFKLKPRNNQKVTLKTNVAEIVSDRSTLNVSTYDNNLSLACLEGNVLVKIKNGQEMRLKPGSALVYDFDNKSWTTSNVNIDTVASWMWGVYYIDQEKLKNISKRIERVYGVKTVFDCSSCEEVTFTGKFERTDSVRVILEDIREASKLKYIFDKNGVIHWR